MYNRIQNKLYVNFNSLFYVTRTNQIGLILHDSIEQVKEVIW